MAGNIAKRSDGRWRARYRDDTGKERARHFERRIEAQRWLDEIASSVLTGDYVDPKHGQISFAEFYAEWSARQVWADGTRIAADAAAGAVPFAAVPLAALRRSHVEQLGQGDVGPTGADNGPDSLQLRRHLPPGRCR